MVVRRAHVGLAQIGVRVDLQHRQPRVLRRHRGDERAGNRVFAAERQQKLVARHDLRRDAPDGLHDIVHRREREIHLRHREDADGVDVGFRFLVPQLHVRRGDEDLVRTVARARHVRRRAIERNRQDDDAGVVESRCCGRKAAELSERDVVEVKRQIHSLPRSDRWGPAGRRSSSRGRA